MTYGLTVSTLPTYNLKSETKPMKIFEGQIIDCVVDRWSRWSKCSVSCGRGYKTRNRSIRVSLHSKLQVDLDVNRYECKRSRMK
jgi:hypothetical protein